jgi:thiamine-phosphate pyrophosphorylase
MRNIDLSLYLVTDRDMIKNSTLPALVHHAVENGVTAVQLREKEIDTRLFIRLALDLKKILDPLQIPLIINDRVDVALAVDASGVHLGQHDMPVSIARNLLGDDKIIGLSVESEKDVENADALSADYLGVSPIFSTPTKTDTVIEWGLDGLQKIKSMTDYPLVAIGGINSENATRVLKHGADGIAVVSAICAAENPGKASKQLRELIDSVKSPNLDLNR